jgi:hypothetical protein
MPVISTFHGIIIRMDTLDNQHRGRPHRHARHAGLKASIRVEDGELLARKIPLDPFRIEPL